VVFEEVFAAGGHFVEAGEELVEVVVVVFFGFVGHGAGRRVGVAAVTVLSGFAGFGGEFAAAFCPEFAGWVPVGVGRCGCGAFDVFHWAGRSSLGLRGCCRSRLAKQDGFVGQPSRVIWSSVSHVSIIHTQTSMVTYLTFALSIG
jgi:hypothetical protein